MKNKIKKIFSSKTKIVNLIIVLVLFIGGCAVPFETAETLERGKSQTIVGYSPINNLTMKANWGITGYTDIGAGLDLVLPYFLHSLASVSAKQKLLSLDLTNEKKFNLLISGSSGILLAENESPGYYQANSMIGFEGKETLLTIGGGILKDPRYAYDFMHNSYDDEVFRHIFLGLKGRKFMMQMQFVFRGEYKGDIVSLGIAHCK